MADHTNQGQSVVKFEDLEAQGAMAAERKARMKVKSLSTTINEMICVGRALPSEDILRYLMECSLTEFQCSKGLERTKWYELALRTVGMEHKMRTKDESDEESQAKQAMLVDLFKKTSKRIKVRDAETEDADGTSQESAG